MVADSFSPSAASTSSNTRRAGANWSARALPIPTVWLPCPGNTNATAIDNLPPLCVVAGRSGYRRARETLAALACQAPAAGNLETTLSTYGPGTVSTHRRRPQNEHGSMGAPITEDEFARASGDLVFRRALMARALSLLLGRIAQL